MNKHSTDAITEDVIRSFVQVSASELHLKTLVEKRDSELDNDLVDFEEISFQEFVENIEDLKEELIRVAAVRRELMLYIYRLHGGVGDKERWCQIKHYGMASITIFEAWQADPKCELLYNHWQELNALFVGSLSRFLGIEITECASCFGDMMKGEDTYETT